jgi:hypothetical protein
MFCRDAIGAFAAAVLCVFANGAQAQDVSTYRPQRNRDWVQNICTVGNMHVQIGKDAYFLSADGLLMPTRKDQAPPDLKYFKQSRN